MFPSTLWTASCDRNHKNPSPIPSSIRVKSKDLPMNYTVKIPGTVPSHSRQHTSKQKVCGALPHTSCSYCITTQN